MTVDEISAEVQNRELGVITDSEEGDQTIIDEKEQKEQKDEDAEEEEEGEEEYEEEGDMNTDELGELDEEEEEEEEEGDEVGKAVVGQGRTYWIWFFRKRVPCYGCPPRFTHGRQASRTSDWLVGE